MSTNTTGYITFSELGLARMGEMVAYVLRVREAFGEHSDAYRMTVDSLLMAQAWIARLGGTVHSDGANLSLYIVANGGLHVGCIFRPTSAHRDEYVADPANYSGPGEWTFHS